MHLRMQFLKFITCILIIISSDLLCSASNDYPILCSSPLNQANESCYCFTKTNPQSYLPETNVDCSSLTLTNLEEDNFTSVTNLDFSINVLTRLEHSQMLIESENLLILKFSHNKITFIDDKYFALLPNLKQLYLNHNELETLDTYVFGNLEKLEILDLSHNNFKTFSDGLFGPLKGLSSLNLAFNKELGPSLTNFMKTKREGLFGPTLLINQDLKTINLEGVGFKILPDDFFENSKLEKITLSQNLFEEMPHIPYTATYFDFSGNTLHVLAARDLNYHALKTLKLERMNNLTTIDKYAFYNLQNLEHLSLSYNPNLKNLEPLAFGVLVDEEKLSLKTLSLKNCGLESLNQTYAKLFTYIEKVDLSYNPWNCNCSLKWIQMHKKIAKNQLEVKCSSPTKLLNSNLFNAAIPDCDNQGYSTLHKVLLPLMGILIVTLCGIIGYLIYMGPFNYRSKRGIGPQSPYKNILVNEQ